MELAGDRVLFVLMSRETSIAFVRIKRIPLINIGFWCFWASFLMTSQDFQSLALWQRPSPGRRAQERVESVISGHWKPRHGLAPPKRMLCGWFYVLNRSNPFWVLGGGFFSPLFKTPTCWPWLKLTRVLSVRWVETSSGDFKRYEKRPLSVLLVCGAGNNGGVSRLQGSRHWGGDVSAAKSRIREILSDWW